MRRNIQGLLCRLALVYSLLHCDFKAGDGNNQKAWPPQSRHMAVEIASVCGSELWPDSTSHPEAWRGTRPENTPICPPQGRVRAPCLSEESEVLELKYAKKRNWRKLGQVVFLRSVSGGKWDLGSSTPKRYLPVYYSKTLKQPAGRWLWSPSCVERIMLTIIKHLVSTSHFLSVDNKHIRWHRNSPLGSSMHL